MRLVRQERIAKMKEKKRSESGSQAGVERTKLVQYFEAKGEVVYVSTCSVNKITGLTF